MVVDRRHQSSVEALQHGLMATEIDERDGQRDLELIAGAAIQRAAEQLRHVGQDLVVGAEMHLGVELHRLHLHLPLAQVEVLGAGGEPLRRVGRLSGSSRAFERRDQIVGRGELDQGVMPSGRLRHCLPQVLEVLG